LRPLFAKQNGGSQSSCEPPLRINQQRAFLIVFAFFGKLATIRQLALSTGRKKRIFSARSILFEIDQ